MTDEIGFIDHTPPSDAPALRPLDELIDSLLDVARAQMPDSSDEFIPMLAVEDEDGRRRALVMLHSLGGTDFGAVVLAAMSRCRSEFTAARLALVMDTYTSDHDDPAEPLYEKRFAAGDTSVSESICVLVVTPYEASTTTLRYRRPDAGPIVWMEPETTVLPDDGAEGGSGVGMLRSGLLGGRLADPLDLGAETMLIALRARLGDDGEVELSAIDIDSSED
jgi:hypothetical protein